MGGNNNTDWEFIFDGVLGYLTSPIWQIPISSFIEKNCLVFDPSQEDCPNWLDVHGSYKTLVEDLLSSYLSDVGISEEQFVKACSSERLQQTTRMQAVFEQIWAAEDFEVFKRMMVQKNVELELQALQLIQQRHRHSRSNKQQYLNPRDNRLVDEDEILNEVIKQSKDEYEKSTTMKDGNKKYYDVRMEKIIASSEKENEKLKEEAIRREKEMKESMSQSIAQVNTKRSESPEKTGEQISPSPGAKPKASSQMTNSPKQEEKDTQKPISDIPISQEKQPTKQKAETLNERKVTNETQVEDLKIREKYLKEQRDRLLAMKKQEREKRLEQYTAKQPARPSSARVARNAVSSDENSAKTKESKNEIDPKKLAMRKALAARLKKEVIYK